MVVLDEYVIKNEKKLFGMFFMKSQGILNKKVQKIQKKNFFQNFSNFQISVWGT